MEALGDLKVGETERLKEFGFKFRQMNLRKRAFPAYREILRAFSEVLQESLRDPEQAWYPPLQEN